ncbi:hypothetical protein EMMF5_002822 [Cystobasidiomycetes sp. EMM_F5]
MQEPAVDVGGQSRCASADTPESGDNHCNNQSTTKAERKKTKKLKGVVNKPPKAAIYEPSSFWIRQTGVTAAKVTSRLWTQPFQLVGKPMSYGELFLSSGWLDAEGTGLDIEKINVFFKTTQYTDVTKFRLFYLTGMKDLDFIIAMLQSFATTTMQIDWRAKIAETLCKHIVKTTAKSKWKVTDAQLKTIYEVPIAKQGFRAQDAKFVYFEEDVRRLAYKVHGGPSGHANLLAKLAARAAKARDTKQKKARAVAAATEESD